MTKTPGQSVRPLLIMGLAVVVLGIVLAALPRTSGPKTTSFGKPLTLWARLVEASQEQLVVTLVKAPGTATAAETETPGSEPSMTVTLGPATKLTADYYVGNVVTGTLVHSQPLRLEKLRTGVILSIVVLPANDKTLIAQAVSWPQSITPTVAAPPSTDIKIPPRMSPP